MVPLEAGLKSFLTDKQHFVDELFSHGNMNFQYKDEEREQPFIVCTDTRKLVENIFVKRNLEFQQVRFKLGIDGGGGFLKICLNTIREGSHQDQPKKRRLFQDGIAGAPHEDTSVQKLHILCVVPDVPETHENVSKVWNLIDQDPLEDYGNVKVAADLKLCNIMLGLQNHASTHPCAWCDIER